LVSAGIRSSEALESLSSKALDKVADQPALFVALMTLMATNGMKLSADNVLLTEVKIDGNSATGILVGGTGIAKFGRRNGRWYMKE